jgi:hypothetical protein
VKTAQNPNRRSAAKGLHALLGALTERKTRSLKKDATAVQIIQPIDEEYALQLVIENLSLSPAIRCKNYFLNKSRHNKTPPTPITTIASE